MCLNDVNYVQAVLQSVLRLQKRLAVPRTKFLMVEQQKVLPISLTNR
jgi:hypothetical protein